MRVETIRGGASNILMWCWSWIILRVLALFFGHPIPLYASDRRWSYWEVSFQGNQKTGSVERLSQGYFSQLLLQIYTETCGLSSTNVLDRLYTKVSILSKTTSEHRPSSWTQHYFRVPLASSFVMYRRSTRFNQCDPTRHDKLSRFTIRHRRHWGLQQYKCHSLSHEHNEKSMHLQAEMSNMVLLASSLLRFNFSSYSAFLFDFGCQTNLI